MMITEMNLSDRPFNYSLDGVKEIQLVKILGMGVGGSVVLGKIPNTNLLCAIKRISLKCLEHVVLATLRHPNIIRLIRSVDTIDRRLLFLEYFEGEELFRLINKGPIPQSIVLAIFKQIASAVAYLHGLNIVHGDLKPENILVDSKLKVKLIDFGLARSAKKPGRGPWGSVEYAPPDVCSGQLYDLKAAEMWTLGMVLYTMVYRTLPGESPKAPEAANPKYSDILDHLLAKDPLKRPSSIDLLSKLESTWW